MKAWLAGIAMALALASGPSAGLAQGCSQCKDNVAATSPKTQAGFRRGIAVLGSAALLVFGGTLLVAMRARRDSLPSR